MSDKVGRSINDHVQEEPGRSWSPRFNFPNAGIEPEEISGQGFFFSLTLNTSTPFKIQSTMQRRSFLRFLGIAATVPAVLPEVVGGADIQPVVPKAFTSHPGAHFDELAYKGESVWKSMSIDDYLAMEAERLCKEFQEFYQKSHVEIHRKVYDSLSVSATDPGG